MLNNYFIDERPRNVISQEILQVMMTCRDNAKTVWNPKCLFALQSSICSDQVNFVRDETIIFSATCYASLFQSINWYFDGSRKSELPHVYY